MLQDVLLHAPRCLTQCSKISYPFAREAQKCSNLVSPRLQGTPQSTIWAPKINMAAECGYSTITQYLLSASHVLGMQTAPRYRCFHSKNLPKLLIWHTPSSQTSTECTFCYKMSTPCSKMSNSMLQDVLLNAPRYLTPSRARPKSAVTWFPLDGRESPKATVLAP